MKTHINIGVSEKRKVNIDLDILLRTRLLIQANSGGGKSWLLRRIAEQGFGKIQIIIVDPEGEFATLREQYGYVLVGKGGETPADVRSAALVAHKLLELHASAVCDLYEMKASQRHAWVRVFLDAIVDAPKHLWHPVLIIVDEAHNFCPEKGTGESEASDAMIGLATRGRKRGFCAIFATQRLGKLRKDAAAELTNVLVGQTFIDVDRKRAAESLGIPRSEERNFFNEMKVVEPGNFWALGRAVSKERILVQIGEVTTTHPEPGSSKHSIEPPPPPAKIKSLLPKLSDLPREAEQKAKTEADLRTEIASLKRQLAARPTVPVPEAKIVEVPVVKKQDIKAIKEAAGQMRKALDKITDIHTAWGHNLTEIGGRINKLIASLIEDHQKQRNRDVKKSAERIGISSPSQDEFSKPLPLGERKVLTAIAQHQGGVSREQITVLTGYKRSSRDAYVSRLRERGLVEAGGSKIEATNVGIIALGPAFEPLPTGAELRDYWMHHLPAGEKKILEALLAVYPKGVNRDDLDGPTGFKRSSRDAYLSRLMARQLVTLGPAGRGSVKVSEILF